VQQAAHIYSRTTQQQFVQTINAAYRHWSGMQIPKAEPQNWYTFLSSLQASQQPAVHNWAANEPVNHDWAGTVYWNGVWDKALDAEAKVVQERQQAVLEEEASAPSQPAAAPTTGVKIRGLSCLSCVLLATFIRTEIDNTPLFTLLIV